MAVLSFSLDLWLWALIGQNKKQIIYSSLFSCQSFCYKLFHLNFEARDQDCFVFYAWEQLVLWHNVKDRRGHTLYCSMAVYQKHRTLKKALLAPQARKQLHTESGVWWAALQKARTWEIAFGKHHSSCWRLPPNHQLGRIMLNSFFLNLSGCLGIMSPHDWSGRRKVSNRKASQRTHPKMGKAEWGFCQK